MQLIFSDNSNFVSDVSPDGQTYAFQTERTSETSQRLINAVILAQTIGGANQSVQLTDNGYLPRRSPNGNKLAFLRSVNGQIPARAGGLNFEEIPVNPNSESKVWFLLRCGMFNILFAFLQAQTEY